VCMVAWFILSSPSLVTRVIFFLLALAHNKAKQMLFRAPTRC
jgi:hypothetical protein